MQLINGKSAAENLRNNIHQEIMSLKKSGFREPHLAIIKIGANDASDIYVKHKIKACEEVGIKVSHYEFVEINKITLINLVQELNKNAEIDAILVQLPVPKPLIKREIIPYISPNKDVDGYHPINIGYLATAHPRIIPATPLGIKNLLQHYNLDFYQKNIVIVGRSNIVGRPLFYLFSNPPYNNTITLCHRFTQNLEKITSQADILMVAIGKPNFITENYIKEGAIVVDVGINRLKDEKGNSKIVGDVHFEQVKDKCKAITPVPGGVGLMTVATLLSNTLKLFKVNLNINN